MWNYSTTFDQPAGAAPDQLLVFSGIKMGAKVWLNGHVNFRTSISLSF